MDSMLERWVANSLISEVFWSVSPMFKMKTFICRDKSPLLRGQLANSYSAQFYWTTLMYTLSFVWNAPLFSIQPYSGFTFIRNHYYRVRFNPSLWQKPGTKKHESAIMIARISVIKWTLTLDDTAFIRNWFCVLANFDALIFYPQSFVLRLRPSWSATGLHKFTKTLNLFSIVLLLIWKSI